MLTATVTNRTNWITNKKRNTNCFCFYSVMLANRVSETLDKPNSRSIKSSFIININSWEALLSNRVTKNIIYENIICHFIKLLLIHTFSQ